LLRAVLSAVIPGHPTSTKPKKLLWPIRRRQRKMNIERLKWIISGLDFEKLNEWEERFVEDVEDYFKRKGNLTEKQEEIIERIYREKAI
jgi:hypothetical protein